MLDLGLSRPSEAVGDKKQMIVTYLANWPAILAMRTTGILPPKRIRIFAHFRKVADIPHINTKLI
jgi:hypothetical protein